MEWIWKPRRNFQVSPHDPAIFFAGYRDYFLRSFRCAGLSCPLDFSLVHCHDRDRNFSADQTQIVKFGNIALAATYYPEGGLYVRFGFGPAIQHVKGAGDSSG